MSDLDRIGHSGYRLSMNVHLPPELKKLVDSEVASGHYSSASEVIREGLRLLVEERRWRADVRRKIANGVAQARAGKLIDADKVAARLRKRIAAHRKKRA
jgi:antitoxin ParD1/3/4